MTQKHAAKPHWSTSAFGSPADTSPMELAALGEHLTRCNAQRGPWRPLRSVTEAMRDFAAPRLITTLALMVALTAAAALLI